MSDKNNPSLFRTLGAIPGRIRSGRTSVSNRHLDAGARVSESSDSEDEEIKGLDLAGSTKSEDRSSVDDARVRQERLVMDRQLDKSIADKNEELAKLQAELNKLHTEKFLLTLNQHKLVKDRQASRSVSVAGRAPSVMGRGSRAPSVIINENVSRADKGVPRCRSVPVRCVSEELGRPRDPDFRRPNSILKKPIQTHVATSMGGFSRRNSFGTGHIRPIPVKAQNPTIPTNVPQGFVPIGNQEIDMLKEHVAHLYERLEKPSISSKRGIIHAPLVDDSSELHSRRIKDIKGALGMTFSKNECIVTYLSHFGSLFENVRPMLTSADLNMVLFSSFPIDMRREILTYLDHEESLCSIPTESFMQLLIELYSENKSSCQLNQSFYNYRLGQESSIVKVISDLYRLGHAAGKSVDEIIEKLIDCLAGIGMDNDLRSRIDLQMIRCPNWTPTALNVLDIIGNSRKSYDQKLSYRAKRNRDQPGNVHQVSNNDHNGKGVKGKHFKNKAPPKTDGQNAQVHQVQGQGNGQGQGQGQGQAQRQVPTCAACLRRGHDASQCRYITFCKCTLCGDSAHVAPHCNKYRDKNPVITPCKKCSDNGRTLFHRFNDCLEN